MSFSIASYGLIRQNPVIIAAIEPDGRWLKVQRRCFKVGSDDGMCRGQPRERIFRFANENVLRISAAREGGRIVA